MNKKTGKTLKIMRIPRTHWTKKIVNFLVITGMSCNQLFSPTKGRKRGTIQGNKLSMNFLLLEVSSDFCELIVNFVRLLMHLFGRC